MHIQQKRKRGRGTGGVGKAIVMGLLTSLQGEVGARSKRRRGTVNRKFATMVKQVQGLQHRSVLQRIES